MAMRCGGYCSYDSEPEVELVLVDSIIYFDHGIEEYIVVREFDRIYSLVDGQEYGEVESHRYLPIDMNRDQVRYVFEHQGGHDTLTLNYRLNFYYASDCDWQVEIEQEEIISTFGDDGFMEDGMVKGRMGKILYVEVD